MTDLFQFATYGMIGVGLAASCGFRVFVPLLFLSVAIHGKLVELSSGWEWVGSWPAMFGLGVATFIEVAGFFIPWIDHVLDVAATPSAVIAGALATTACVSQTDPGLAWAFGVIAGGGAAAVVQGGTVLARATSTATTGGLGNPLVALVELVSSVVMSALAIFVPILAFLAFVGMAVVTLRLFLRWRRRHSAGALTPSA